MPNLDSLGQEINRGLNSDNLIDNSKLSAAPDSVLKAPGGSVEAAMAPNKEAEQQELRILRIRRITKRLFGVANCIVSFGQNALAPVANARSMAAIEVAFCASLPLPVEPMIVSDTRAGKWLSNHRFVVGAPYIRFYAAQPIFNDEHIVVGSIALLDYAARAFSEEDRLLLADMGQLVERELHMNEISALQLDLVKKNRHLRRDALIDPVVGTWNRVAITRVLSTEIERCNAEDKSLSLILADLDSLKAVNDVFGLPAGDNVLLKSASRLRSCLRPSDALGRYEGGKFMIVLPGSSHATVMVVAERMRQIVMTQTESIGETAVPLTLSLGTISTDVFPFATIDELITQADLALHSAKNSGRNRVVQALPQPIDSP
ncbi:MAG: sensor domain-containing diguanylate cyclase [Pseudomonadota bacterium]